MSSSSSTSRRTTTSRTGTTTGSTNPLARSSAGKDSYRDDDDDDDERSTGGEDPEGEKKEASKAEAPKDEKKEEGKETPSSKPETPKPEGEAEKKEGSKQEAPKEEEKKEEGKKDEEKKEEEKKGDEKKEEEKKGEEKKDEEKKGEEKKDEEKKGEEKKEDEKKDEKKEEKKEGEEGEKKAEQKPEGDSKMGKPKKKSKKGKTDSETPSKTKSTLSKASASKASEDKKSKAQVIEGKMTGALLFATIAVTLGSFQFGYNIGCINAPGGMITEWIIVAHKEKFGSDLDKETADIVWSVIVSAFPVGGALGGLISGVLADKAGRKGGLLYTNILSILAAVCMGIAKPIGMYPTMIVGRFLIGIYAGLSILVPIYLTEVSPTNLRGMLGSSHQLLVTIAILVSQVLGLPFLFGTPDRWPLIFWFIIVPSVVQIIFLQMVPESPKYTLCMKGDAERATQDLEKLRGSNDVGAEIEMMREEAAAAKGAAAEKPSMGDMFKAPLLWPMTIAMSLMLTQQLSGINAVMFYSTVIFQTAKLSAEAAVYATIAVGTVNVLMTIISVWLVDHPKAGRRALLIIGIVGMWLTTALLVVCITMAMQGQTWASYGAIAFVLLYVVSFATGAGSIPWFFVSEIFASNARGNANAIATMTNWAANVFVGLTFLPLNNAIKQYSILVFTGCLTVALIFVVKYVPETKGRTVEEITAEFEKK